MSIFNNPIKRKSPITKVNIVKVVKWCLKTKAGTWSYKGRVFYQKDNVISVVNVSSDNWDSLEKQLKKSNV